MPLPLRPGPVDTRNSEAGKMGRLTPDDYRREAALAEQAAAAVSFQPDKESLLATARSLRFRADVAESRLEDPPGAAAQTRWTRRATS